MSTGVTTSPDAGQAEDIREHARLQGHWFLPSYRIMDGDHEGDYLESCGRCGSFMLHSGAPDGPISQYTCDIVCHGHRPAVKAPGTIVQFFLLSREPRTWRMVMGDEVVDAAMHTMHKNIWRASTSERESFDGSERRALLDIAAWYWGELPAEFLYEPAS